MRLRLLANARARAHRNVLADERMAAGLPLPFVFFCVLQGRLHVLLVHLVIVTPGALGLGASRMPRSRLDHSRLELGLEAVGFKHPFFHHAELRGIRRVITHTSHRAALSVLLCVQEANADLVLRLTLGKRLACRPNAAHLTRPPSKAADFSPYEGAALERWRGRRWRGHGCRRRRGHG